MDEAKLKFQKECMDKNYMPLAEGVAPFINEVLASMPIFGQFPMYRMEVQCKFKESPVGGCFKMFDLINGWRCYDEFITALQMVGLVDLSKKVFNI